MLDMNRVYESRIAALEARISNLHVQLEAADSQSAALEAEVLEFRRALALAKPCVDQAANRIEHGNARIAAPIMAAKAIIDRLLNKDDHDDREGE